MEWGELTPWITINNSCNFYSCTIVYADSK